MPIIILILKLVGKLPFSTLYRVSGLVKFVLQKILKYRQAVIIGNLRRSFIQKTNDEIAAIADEFYGYLSRMIVETIKTWRITEDELLERVSYANAEVLQAKIDDQKSVIIMMGHSGNWEWASLATRLKFGIEIMPVYRKIKSKPLDIFYFKLRSRFGVKPVLDKTAFNDISSTKGQKAVALLADQTPSAKKGLWLTFLNQDTPFYRGAGILANRLNYDVLFAQVRPNEQFGYYTIHFEDLTPLAEDKQQLMLGFAKRLEQEIAKEPSNWLWSHKRWKHKPDGNSLFIS